MGASVHLDPMSQIRALGPAGVTVAEYMRMTGLAQNAARNQLNTRVKQGVLEKLDPAKGADGREAVTRYRLTLARLADGPPEVGSVRQEDGLRGDPDGLW